MQSLAKVQAGESCEIKWMFGNADVMNFLERYGIKEGSRIRVLGRVLDGLIIGNGKCRRIAKQSIPVFVIKQHKASVFHPL